MYLTEIVFVKTSDFTVQKKNKVMYINVLHFNVAHLKIVTRALIFVNFTRLSAKLYINVDNKLIKTKHSFNLILISLF